MSDRREPAATHLGVGAGTVILTLEIGVAKDLYQALSLALGPSAAARETAPAPERQSAGPPETEGSGHG